MQRMKPGKQPAEIFWIEGDFAAELQDGETVVLTGSTCVEESLTLASGSNIIVPGSLMVGSGNSSLMVQLSGGTEGDKRKITFRAATSEGNLYEIDVVIPIID